MHRILKLKRSQRNGIENGNTAWKDMENLFQIGSSIQPVIHFVPKKNRCIWFAIEFGIRILFNKFSHLPEQIGITQMLINVSHDV